MLDRKAVYARYASCYSVKTPAALAALLGLKRQTVYEWISGKRQVPWGRLKIAVDNYNLSWDWLLDGKSPKIRPQNQHQTCKSLDRKSITQRFLDIFQGKNRSEIARLLDITPVAVHYMYENEMKAPWDKLQIAVDNHGTTWEWLLEGRGTKKAPRKGGAKE